MAYKKYHFFYTNGSSHTKGGGFESLNRNIIDGYKNLYDIDVPGVKQVNWADRLSKLLQIKCYNEATSGGGVDRVVRMTYEFIENNWDDRHKFFIILEKPEGGRYEIFYKKTQTHYIINDYFFEKKFSYATNDYFNEMTGTHDLQPVFEQYYDNFVDQIEDFKNKERQYAGLYAYCKHNGIAIKLLREGFLNQGAGFKESDVVSYKNDDTNLELWAIKNKKRISDDLIGITEDNHPGYFGHIEYAELVKKWLDKNLEEAIG